MKTTTLPIRERIVKETETVYTAKKLLFTLYSNMADIVEAGLSQEEFLRRIGNCATESLRGLSYVNGLPDGTRVFKETVEACDLSCNDLCNACQDPEATIPEIQEKMLSYGEKLQGLSDAADLFVDDLKKAAGGRLYMELESLTAAAKQLRKMGLIRILDYGCAFDRAGIIGRNLAGQYTCEELHIDGACDDPEKITPFTVPYLYERIINDPETTYEAVLLMNLYDGTNASELADLIRYTERFATYAFFNILPDQRGDLSTLKEALSVFPRYMTIPDGEHILVIVDNTAGTYAGQAAVYAVTHKPFHAPEYPMYIPIHAGSIDKESLGYPGDHTGENISSLNPYINECTALYWMWKNDNHAIVGLNHYRRYFAPQGMDHANDWLLTETVLSDIMKRCDMILANVAYCYPMTIEQHLQKMFDYSRASLEAPDIVRNVIRERQPDYVKHYDRVMQGHTFYLCNLFITKHAIMDAYCSWLFSFLPEAVVAVNTAMGNDGFRDTKDMRIVGFIAERLLTVWLLEQHLRIECLPIVNGGNL